MYKGMAEAIPDETRSISKHWEIKELQEIAKVIDSCHKTPKYSTHGIAMLRVTDIKEGYLNLSGTLKVTKEVYNEFTKNHVPQPNDIVMSRVGTYGVASFAKTTQSFCLGQNTVIIHSKQDSKFLYYALRSPVVKRQIEQMVVGSTQKTISLKNIRELKIPFPQHLERDMIGQTLSYFDEKIELNNQMNATLEAIGGAVFKRWFVDFEFPNEEGKPYKSSGGEMTESEKGNIPKGWKIKRFEEITEAIFSGGTPDTRNSEYWDGDYSWLSSGETSKHFILKTEKKITKKGIENSSTRLAKKGDIVIASAGQGKTRGQASLCLIDTYVNQSVNVVRSKNSIVPNSFLFLNLSLRYPQLRAISDSFSIRGSLTTKLIKDLEVVLPPLKNTCAFDEWFILAIRKIQSNLIENDALSKIRDLLLPKLMSGRIRVPPLKEKTEET